MTPFEVVRRNVVALSVAGDMAILKLAVTLWLRGTFIVPFNGVVAMTAGGVGIPGAESVVKLHT